jgi:hypothetical protein
MGQVDDHAVLRGARRNVTMADAEPTPMIMSPSLRC